MVASAFSSSSSIGTDASPKRSSFLANHFFLVSPSLSHSVSVNLRLCLKMDVVERDSYAFSGKQASKRFGGNEKMLKSKLNLVIISPPSVKVDIFSLI